MEFIFIHFKFCHLNSVSSFRTMDKIDFQVDDIMKKWQGHHLGNSDLNGVGGVWYKDKDCSSYDLMQPKRHRKKPTQQTFVSLEPCKFRLQPVLLSTKVQTYEISACKQCETNNISRIVANKERIQSESRNLLKDAVKQYGIFSFFGFIRNFFNQFCYQTKDKRFIQKQCKDIPMLYVFQSNNSFKNTILVHLYLCYINGKNVPIFMEDVSLLSPFLKFILGKFGFTFLDDSKEAYFMLQKQSIALPMDCNILSEVFDMLRAEEKESDCLLLPLSIATEENEASPSPDQCGLVHITLSRPQNLKVLLSHSKKLNMHEVANEDNLIMKRHLNFVTLNAEVVLPVNILSFLFIVKFRRGVKLGKLICSVSTFLKDLRDMNIYMGFSATPHCLTTHALNILLVKGLVSMDDSYILPSLNDRVAAENIFSYSRKLLLVYARKSIMASSIMACLGGDKVLTQGNGTAIPCDSEEILLKGAFLAELLTFAFDHDCCLYAYENVLVETFNEFVNEGIINSREDIYEDENHRRLVRRLDDLDEDGGAIKTGQRYNFNPSTLYLEKMKFLCACVMPFIELFFSVILLVVETSKDVSFTDEDLLQKLLLENSVLCHETLCKDQVRRCCEFLFENEFIDDLDEQAYLNSKSNEHLLELLHQLNQFRCTWQL